MTCKIQRNGWVGECSGRNLIKSKFVGSFSVVNSIPTHSNPRPITWWVQNYLATIYNCWASTSSSFAIIVFSSIATARHQWKLKSYACNFIHHKIVNQFLRIIYKWIHLVDLIYRILAVGWLKNTWRSRCQRMWTQPREFPSWVVQWSPSTWNWNAELLHWKLLHNRLRPSPQTENSSKYKEDNRWVLCCESKMISLPNRIYSASTHTD